MIKESMTFIVGLVVGLFSTFVMQNLWNWFVVPAFNIHVILFWQMYGIFLLIDFLSDHIIAADDQRWKVALSLLDACVPENEREYTRGLIADMTVGIWQREFTHAFREIVGGGVVLTIGWVVHAFLA